MMHTMNSLKRSSETAGLPALQQQARRPRYNGPALPMELIKEIFNFQMSLPMITSCSRVQIFKAIRLVNQELNKWYNDEVIIRFLNAGTIYQKLPGVGEQLVFLTFLNARANQMKDLNISNNNVKGFSLSPLQLLSKNLTNLKVLSLSNFSVDLKILIDKIENLPNLQSLRMKKVIFARKDQYAQHPIYGLISCSKKGIKPLQNVLDLHLIKCESEKFDFKYFPALESLEIETMKWRDDITNYIYPCEFDFSELIQLKKLSVILDADSFTSLELNFSLHTLSTSTSLEKIYLDCVELSGSLTVVKNMPHLKNLSLINTDVSDISFLSDLPIEHLDLCKNIKLSDFSPLSNILTLKKLSLEGGAEFISDEDVYAAINNLPELKYLKLPSGIERKFSS